MATPPRAALFLIAASACTITGPADESSDGGTDGGSSASSCAAPNGQYALTFQPTGGNCETPLPQYPVFDGTKQASSTGCAGDYTSSAGGCHDSYTLRCPLVGQEIDLSGTYDWNADGKSAQGSMTRSLVTLTTDSSGQVIGTTTVCTSTYTVSLIKT
jgi:hypothetical protein